MKDLKKSLKLSAHIKCYVKSTYCGVGSEWRRTNTPENGTSLNTTQDSNITNLTVVS